MPNDKNLVSIGDRTTEEQRRITSAGGRASGVARRRKRSLREAADLYLSLPVANRKKWNAIAKEGVDPEDIDNQMAMIIGLTQAAMGGDAKAAKIIVDLIGEAPTDSGKDTNNLLEAIKDTEVNTDEIPEAE